ncbi:MAG: hypothetical protein ACLUE1_08355 [Adlercreutzia equolifaciens]
MRVDLEIAVEHVPMAPRTADGVVDAQMGSYLPGLTVKVPAFSQSPRQIIEAGVNERVERRREDREPDRAILRQKMSSLKLRSKGVTGS